MSGTWSANMTSSASKIVTLVLFGYLVSRIVESVIKLQTKEIGTTVTRRDSDAVMFPTMTFCSSQNKKIENGLLTIQKDQQYKGSEGALRSSTGSLNLMRRNKNFVNTVQFYLQNDTS